MQTETPPAIAISSWSLHRTLGIFHPNAPGNDVVGQAEPRWGAGSLTLLDLPGEIARRGIDRLQLCHFHLESRDPAYLGEVRAAIADAGVTLTALLIDDGDITHPSEQTRQRDRAWIGEWIDAAATLGAEAARVIAGKQKPTQETLGWSAEGLTALSRRGAEQGVRVTTENWLALLESPREVHDLLDRLDGAVGFMADFGNLRTTGAQKYSDLESILVRSEDTHAKARFLAPNAIDGDDFGQCLAAARAAGYRGPYTLIYEDQGDDEWAALEIERDFVLGAFAGTA